jgi:hypothetical protein
VLSVYQPSKRFRGADAPRRFPIWASSADILQRGASKTRG